MKIQIILLLSFLIFKSEAYGSQFYQNRLQPFATDGCSSFFDGIPYQDSQRWVQCCVKHDIAYWKGGTLDEKNRADKNLEKCVANSGYPTIGKMMNWAVQKGGEATYPTSWNWGLGWVVNRGYSPLKTYELEQVNKREIEIPIDLSLLPIHSTSYIANQISITGDYCLDLASQEIEGKISRGFEIVSVDQKVEEFKKYFWKATYQIRAKECAKPISAQFYLSTRNACVSIHNKMTILSSIKLTQINGVESCQ